MSKHYEVKEHNNGRFYAQLTTSIRSKYLSRWHLEACFNDNPRAYAKADPWNDVSYDGGPAYMVAMFSDFSSASSMASLAVRFVRARDGKDY